MSKEFPVNFTEPLEEGQTTCKIQLLPPEDELTRKALLANMRHDLRTPINAIIGYSEMLLEDVKESDRVELKTFLEKIRLAGRQLLELVNKILDPAQLEAKKIKIGSKEFEAQLGHELRTPLNTAIGYTEILLEEFKEPEGNTITPDLQKISKACKRLYRLIDDIINVSMGSFKTLDVSLATSRNSDFVRETVTSLNTIRPKTVIFEGTGLESVLVVDDNELNRDLLTRYVQRQGFLVNTAENGQKAIDLMSRRPFDLVLLDMMMPEMNGYEVLQRMHKDEAMRHIPVIVISALDEEDAVARCIALGATDYLTKPYNPLLLEARINSSLAIKRMYDMEQAHLNAIVAEQAKSERLLLNILPKAIAQKLKEKEGIIAEYFAEATVLFSDIVGFTSFSANHSPATIVQRLNVIFSIFDQIALNNHLEKIKTIGDGYMVAGGIPIPRPDHFEAIADMALEMESEITRLNQRETEPLLIRIGIHSGPVIAGVIGTQKFAYDLWGDTVNTASRLESNGIPGRIMVSEETYLLLHNHYSFEPHGRIYLKGKGEKMTYLLVGRMNS